MLTIQHPVAGSPVTIHHPWTSADIAPLGDFLRDAGPVLGVHVAGSHDSAYAPGYAIATVTFASRTEAWVLSVDLWRARIREVLTSGRPLAIHDTQAPLLGLDRMLRVPLEQVAPQTFDTRILAHLLDPRGRSEGGVGLTLNDLTMHYGKVPPVPTGTTDEDHTLTAGLTAILTRRVCDVLGPRVAAQGLSDLSSREHRLQTLLTKMSRRGIKVDIAYTRQLRADLDAEATKHLRTAARYGVTSVHQGPQIAAALIAMGEVLTERGKNGEWKVDKSVLYPLADLDADWDRVGARTPNVLADAIIRGRRAAHWRDVYADGFLAAAQVDGRVHATLTGLGARTGRSSVSAPPLQQLPARGHLIRRCLVADPGHAIIASDLSQVEMRVLAGLSRDETMIAAIKDGLDLHQFTAERIYGPDFTPAHRKTSKAVGLGKIYGGGPDTLSLQSGAPVADIRRAMAAYDTTFPGIKRYAAELEQDARKRDRFEVVTYLGRRLPMDPARAYTATNYVCQGSAREVLVDALLSLDDAGLSDMVIMPVHDELVAQAPTANAAEAARVLQSHMTSDFMGVPITADSEVHGRSWGHGYGATD